MYPSGQSEVYGLVSFSQDNYLDKTKMTVHLKNLKPNSSHGFHIHEYGVN